VPTKTAPTRLDFNALRDKIVAAFPDVKPFESDNKQPFLAVPADKIRSLAEFLKDTPEIKLDSLMSLSGLDISKFSGKKDGSVGADDLVCVYLLHSMTHFHALTLKVFTPRANPRTQSVSTVWQVADYFEREIFDLYGVHFEGHPNLKRIMCPEDWVGYPLRKDYVYPTEYNAVPLKRDGQHFDSGPYADKA
jgi:NADH-quinone oxidoreductase subunit C